eukprot:CAMPEP_0173422722 /NCGR_PEP_ID=MMETSP1357-20121228/3317_1 /TAXON_ID=77926 /ORGANISM="Hemiselmis rufescens, Strain PCC563" /LENGTH=285 /DNA_ID=CAMNT_0014385773 /DNA_START=149 /DNA_END=1003 /DNA_ORIENTATION=+
MADQGGAGEEEEDPVLIFSDVLEKIVLRSQSWVDAAEHVRRNIKAIADAERAYSKTMRKLSTSLPSVAFATCQEPSHKRSSAAEDEAPTLLVATNLCFATGPQQLALHHEQTASSLMEAYNGKGAHVEKVAKRSRQAIENAAQGLWEEVVKAREGLAKASRAQEGGAGGDDKWLCEVQLSQWRVDEREASAHYCKQVVKLSEDAHKAEKECVAAMQEALGACMLAQTSNVSKLDLNLEAIARGLKVMDGDADWEAFVSQSTVHAVRSGKVGTEWREWRTEATRRA